MLNTDGLHEYHEGGDTLLHAVNQHTYDGDAEHIHGGGEAPDSRGEETFDAGDRRIVSTGHATAASAAVQVHVRGDGALHDAGAGTALAGQGGGQFLGDEADLIVLSDAPAGDGAHESPRAPIRITAGDPRVVSAARVPAPPRTANPILPFAFVPAVTGGSIRALPRLMGRTVVARSMNHTPNLMTYAYLHIA